MLEGLLGGLAGALLAAYLGYRAWRYVIAIAIRMLERSFDQELLKFQVRGAPKLIEPAPVSHDRFEETFQTRTPAGFIAEYRLTVAATRISGDGSNYPQTVALPLRESSCREFNELKFLPFLRQSNYWFYYAETLALTLPVLQETPPIGVGQLSIEGGTRRLRPIPFERVAKEAVKIPGTMKGWTLSLENFELAKVRSQIIEENYAMIPTEKREALEESEAYHFIDETLAVVILRRQLAFLRNQTRQVYEGISYVIETERAGRSLRVSWRFRDTEFAVIIFGASVEPEAFPRMPLAQKKMESEWWTVTKVITLSIL
jgi:hypothetical protein